MSKNNISIKKNLVHLLKQSIKQDVIIANCKGIKSGDINTFRKNMRDKNAHVRVIKNTLSNIVFKDTIHEQICSSLKDQNIVIFPQEDNFGDITRFLVSLSKTQPAFAIKCCSLSGKIYYPESIAFLSSIPNKNQAINMILGDLISPLMLIHGHLQGLAEKKDNQ